jgi:SAM-dependent methyltransferase
MGFTRIVARGFDVAEAQIRRARVLARDAAGLPGVELRFEVSDLARPLPEADNSIDLALCLYCVLNHAPIADVRRVAGEFARVTRGHFIVTVRAVGSQPTIYVDSIDKARDLRQDHEHDLCEVDLHDGRHLSFASHLFTAVELRGIIGGAMEVDEVRGLDLFHNRFAPDARWNPATLVAPEQFFRELACLEETFATDPNFIDRATHLMAVAHPRSARRRAAMRD